MAEEIVPAAQAGEGAAPRGAPAPIDYRQIERPVEGITPYHLQHSGGAEHAEALQKIFHEWGGAANALAEQGAKKSGVAAGMAAGATGDGSQKTGLAALTTYGSSYNAAVQAAYLSRTKDNLAAHIEQIRQDNEGDPVAFETVARAAAAAALKEAPNAYKPELMIDLNHQINAGIMRTREQQLKTAQSDAWAGYVDTRETRIQQQVKTASVLRGDDQAAVITNAVADDKSRLDALVKARSITPKRSAELHQKFIDDMTTAVHAGHIDYLTSGAMDHVRGGDVTAGDAEWKKYVADPNNSEDDKNAFTAKYLKDSHEYQAMQARLHAEDVAHFGQQLTQGHYGPAIEDRANQMFKQSMITDGQLHQFLDASMRNQLQGIDDDNSNKMVDAMLFHGAPGFDPESPTAKKMADTYLKTHVLASGVAPLSDGWTQAISHFAKLTNILPPSALAQARVSLVQGTPQQQVAAATALERIRADNPNLDPYDKDSKASARANMIDENVKVGMTDQRAVEQADLVLNRPESVKKLEEKKYAEIIRQNPAANTRILQSALSNGVFKYTPTVPNAMVAENDRLVNNFYGITGDISKARTLAAQQLQTVWRQTSMNGAPGDWVKHGIKEEDVPAARASMAEKAPAEWGYHGDVKDLHLIPNQFTDSSDGGAWTVVHVDPKTGDTDTLMTPEHKTVIFSPPAKPDPAIAKAKANEKSIADAKVLKDAQRQNSADQIMFEKQLSDQYFSPHAGRRSAAGV